MSYAQLPAPTGKAPRSPWVVTWRVYKALLIREAVSRVVGNRMAWFWAVLEPMAVIAIVLAERNIRGAGREIQGVSFASWVFVGLISFQLFRSYTRLLGAIDANKGLFTYRQIKPIDTIIIRSFYDFIFISFILFTFISIATLIDAKEIVPQDPIGVLYGWVSMWMLSLSFGLLVSAIASLVEEVKVIVRLASLPLMIISGIIFPITNLPTPLLDYLMYNPIIHIVEFTRSCFFVNYEVVPGTSMIYVWLLSLSMMVLGLMLHVRFKDRIKAQ